MMFNSLDSSLLASAAYDPHRQILRLELYNRAVYLYVGVPAAVHDALLRASSKGAYFNHSIRGRFPFRRLANPTSD